MRGTGGTVTAGAVAVVGSLRSWQPLAVEGGDCLGSEGSGMRLCGKAQGGMKGEV